MIQCYNQRNGCWVLMENGCVKDNQKEPFPDVPKVGENETKEPETTEPEAQPVEPDKELDSQQEPENDYQWW